MDGRQSATHMCLLYMCTCLLCMHAHSEFAFARTYRCPVFEHAIVRTPSYAHTHSNLVCPPGTKHAGEFSMPHVHNWQHAGNYPGFFVSGKDTCFCVCLGVFAFCVCMCTTTSTMIAWYKLPLLVLIASVCTHMHDNRC